MAAAPAPSPSFSLSDRAKEGVTVYNATVKYVVSGDSLTILRSDEQSRNGPPVERTVTLSSIRAPMLGRKDLKEEPFAWEARETLRKLLIGKSVQLIIDFTNPKNGRDYVSVYLKDENVAFQLASQGLVAVVTPATPPKTPRPEMAELARLSQIAQEKGLGIFNVKEKAKAVRNPKKLNTFEFYERNRGKPFDAVVEQIRNGSTVRVTVSHTFENLIVRFAGVQAPFAMKDEEEPPFARESKFLMESVLLGRDIQVGIECLDKSDGVVFAQVSCGGKDPAELLLLTGLAKIVEWNIPKASAAKYKALQEKAQAERIRLWSLPQSSSSPARSPALSPAIASPSRAASSIPQEVVGVVREITNSFGVVIVEDTGRADGQLRAVTVFLSSLIFPRFAVPAGGVDEPWAWEAKELLRSKLVGKSVKATLDYTKAATEKVPEKAFYSVFIGNTNIALSLLERGYAKVMVHREGDARSLSYSSLLNCEQIAISKHKGMHGPAENAPKHQMTELSRNVNVKKAQQFLPFLRQPERQSAVVEYVFGGDRLKLFCPKATCTINFTISGIRCPRVKREDGEEEPFAREVLEYAQMHILQRDVEIEATAVDKGGSFIGRVITKEGKDWALTLVERGMAALHAPSASKLQNARLYFEAEEKAKAQRLRIWMNWSQEEEDRKKKEAEVAAVGRGEKLGEYNPCAVDGQQDWVRVNVTEILDGTSFYYQPASTVDDLEQLMEDINKNVPAYLPSYQPQRGEAVLCLYMDKWYRARVTDVSDDGSEFEVFFLDFGNIDFSPKKALRKCDPSFLLLPPVAQQGALAYVQSPSPNEDFGSDAALHLRKCVWDKPIVGTLEYEESGKKFFVLGDSSESILVNAAMVRAGFARVLHTKARRAKTVYEKLKAAEEHAKKGHLNIWRYGDLPDDDLDEPEYGGYAKAAKGKK